MSAIEDRKKRIQAAVEQAAAENDSQAIPESEFVSKDDFLRETIAQQAEEQRETIAQQAEEQRPGFNPKPRRGARIAPKEAPIRSSHKVLAEELSVIIGASAAGLSFVLDKHRPEGAKIWPLDSRETSEMGAAIAEAVPSLSAKKADVIAKAIPPLRLAITFSSIFGVRAIMEWEARKQEQASKIAAMRRPVAVPQQQAQPAANGKAATAPDFEIPGKSP